MARTMVYNFTMPRDKKPAAVKKNRTAVAEEDVDEKKNRTAVAVAEEDVNEKKKVNMYWNKDMFLRVLKQVHPNIHIPITFGALEVMKNIISTIMLKLVRKSYERNLRRKNKPKLSINDVMFAVMEVFPPQMAILARKAARNALTNQRVTKLTDKMNTMSINDVSEAFPPQMPNLALTDGSVSELSAIMDRTMSIK